MTLDDSVHGLRLHAIQRAQAVGNVSAVCRELGISRTLFYGWRKPWERYGADGVHPRRQSARPGWPIQVAPEVEGVVLALAISAATWGCGRLAAYLTREVHAFVSLVDRPRRAAVCFLGASARKLAPLISTKCAPCVSRSSAAEASSASPKSSGHSARSRLLVSRSTPARTAR